MPCRTPTSYLTSWYQVGLQHEQDLSAKDQALQQAKTELRDSMSELDTTQSDESSRVDDYEANVAELAAKLAQVSSNRILMGRERDSDAQLVSASQTVRHTGKQTNSTGTQANRQTAQLHGHADRHKQTQMRAASPKQYRADGATDSF